MDAAEHVISSDLDAVEVNLEGLGLEDLTPLLPLLARMPNLRRLRLPRNKLGQLPEDLSALKSLELLDVSRNNFAGLHSCIRGLFTLHSLRHLWVDLPFETDEDEVIVALNTLESFNGTPLEEQEDLPRDDGFMAAPPAAPPPAAPPLSRSPVAGASVSPSRASPLASWDASCAEDVQKLHDRTASVSTRAGEFHAFTREIVGRLGAALQGADDAQKREAEVLRAKRVLYEFCADGVLEGTRQTAPPLGVSWGAVRAAFAQLLDEYEGSLRAVQEDRDRKLQVMRADMQHAIQEIEQLMRQMDQREDSARRASAQEAASAETLQELSRLRADNEGMRQQITALQAQRQASPEPQWRENSQGGGGATVSRSPSVGRALSLRQLKEIIEDIYASKSRFDIRCSETHLPRETMEQHLYTYLNQKYGLKNLILDWAQAIINAVRKYSGEDNGVAVFGKILRNEIDEEFRFVQRQLAETVHELLRVHTKGRNPNKSDEEIQAMMRKRVSGVVQEDEWVDIVKYMYNSNDSVSIIMRIREIVRERNPPRRARISAGRRGEANAGKKEPASTLPYRDFVQALQDFQLVGHERFLSKFVRVFRLHDTDRNGIVNEAEFIALLKAVDPEKAEDEVTALLDLIDPHNNQLITFSECVTFLSSELVRLSSADPALSQPYPEEAGVERRQ